MNKEVIIKKLQELGQDPKSFKTVHDALSAIYKATGEVLKDGVFTKSEELSLEAMLEGISNTDLNETASSSFGLDVEEGAHLPRITLGATNHVLRRNDEVSRQLRDKSERPETARQRADSAFYESDIVDPNYVTEQVAELLFATGFYDPNVTLPMSRRSGEFDPSQTVSSWIDADPALIREGGSRLEGMHIPRNSFLKRALTGTNPAGFSDVLADYLFNTASGRAAYGNTLKSFHANSTLLTTGVQHVSSNGIDGAKNTDSWFADVFLNAKGLGSLGDADIITLANTPGNFDFPASKVERPTNSYSIWTPGKSWSTVNYEKSVQALWDQNGVISPAQYELFDDIRDMASTMSNNFSNQRWAAKTKISREFNQLVLSGALIDGNAFISSTIYALAGLRNDLQIMFMTGRKSPFLYSVLANRKFWSKVQSSWNILKANWAKVPAFARMIVDREVVELVIKMAKGSLRHADKPFADPKQGLNFIDFQLAFPAGYNTDDNAYTELLIKSKFSSQAGERYAVMPVGTLFNAITRSKAIQVLVGISNGDKPTLDKVTLLPEKQTFLTVPNSTGSKEEKADFNLWLGKISPFNLAAGKDVDQTDTGTIFSAGIYAEANHAWLSTINEFAGGVQAAQGHEFTLSYINELRESTKAANRLVTADAYFETVDALINDVNGLLAQDGLFKIDEESQTIVINKDKVGKIEEKFTYNRTVQNFMRSIIQPIWAKVTKTSGSGDTATSTSTNGTWFIGGQLSDEFLGRSAVELSSSASDYNINDHARTLIAASMESPFMDSFTLKEQIGLGAGQFRPHSMPSDFFSDMDGGKDSGLRPGYRQTDKQIDADEMNTILWEGVGLFPQYNIIPRANIGTSKQYLYKVNKTSTTSSKLAYSEKATIDGANQKLMYPTMWIDAIVQHGSHKELLSDERSWWNGSTAKKLDGSNYDVNGEPIAIDMGEFLINLYGWSIPYSPLANVGTPVAADKARQDARFEEIIARHIKYDQPGFFPIFAVESTSRIEDTFRVWFKYHDFGQTYYMKDYYGAIADAAISVYEGDPIVA